MRLCEGIRVLPGYGLPTTDYRLPTTDSRLLTPDYSELAADFRERVERELQFLTRVRGGDDGAHTCLIARDGRVGDSLREHALLKKPVRELHRQRSVAGNHWR